MAFDYKKEYKEYYLPASTPSIVEVPKMNYIAVRGKGDPGAENSEYQRSISLLYAIAFTIKMSKKATSALMVVSISWFPRWRVFGGRTGSRASIIPIRRISTSSRS